MSIAPPQDLQDRGETVVADIRNAVVEWLGKSLVASDSQRVMRVQLLASRSIRAKPVSRSTLRRKCFGDSIRITSSVGHICASIT